MTTCGNLRLMQNRWIMIRLLLLTLLLFTGCTDQDDSTPTATPLRVTTFKSETGWGYAVIIKAKPYIRQPYIPAINGKLPFKTEQDALKTGRYVCSLIKAGHLPAVRTADLVRIGILPDTLNPVNH